MGQKGRKTVESLLEQNDYMTRSFQKSVWCRCTGRGEFNPAVVWLQKVGSTETVRGNHKQTSETFDGIGVR